jgi:glycosyltransferase involved in cell wall biosynthesis
LTARGNPTRWVAFSRGFTLTNAKVRLYQTIEKILVRRAAHIVAVSGAQKEKLKRLLIKDEQITVARNAIDVDALATVARVDLRARYGFEPGSIIFIAAGRFSIEKGQEILIRAGARVLQRHPQVRFVLFGQGFELEKMRQLTRRLGVENEILCPGFERNMLGCLKGADVLINPSLMEGLPNIVLEGLGFEVPIIATAVGGVPEIVEDGRTGRLIPAGSEEALAAAILETAENMDRSRTMAAAGLRFVRSECTFGRQFEVLASVYERLGFG